ncbi:MAG TPA: S41 family peptidase, partial [Candidatus Saccharimonadales bacterium]|nr:S41 family peptidase [Candidatus Saccharimonadales bacterium]
MEEHNIGIENLPKVKRKKNKKLAKIGIVCVLVLVFLVGDLIGRGGFNIKAGSLHLSSTVHIPALSVGSARTATDAFDYSSVNEVYGLLQKDFDGNLDHTKLLDGIKHGLVSAAGDPYTEYFDPQEAKDLNDQLSGSFTGIGAELGTDEDNNIVVVSPLAGYPADKAGLKSKDIVAGVNGQSTTGMNVDSVVRKIRGPANTDVKLTIVRGSSKPFDVNLTRQEITLPSVKYQEDGNIGYLKISQFTNDTVDLANKAAAEFKAKGVKAIVLDLRGDPGGYLDGAVAISSMWLDQGKTVVSEHRGSTVIDTKYATGSNPFKGIPTVVLIDGGSASAS